MTYFQWVDANTSFYIYCLLILNHSKHFYQVPGFLRSTCSLLLHNTFLSDPRQANLLFLSLSSIIFRFLCKQFILVILKTLDRCNKVIPVITDQRVFWLINLLKFTMAATTHYARSLFIHFND